MTCDEARAIMKKGEGRGGPLGVTRAERWAVKGHFQGCPACQQFVFQQAEEECIRQGVTPERQQEIAEQASLLSLTDLMDPEAQ